MAHSFESKVSLLKGERAHPLLMAAVQSAGAVRCSFFWLRRSASLKSLKQSSQGKLVSKLASAASDPTPHVERQRARILAASLCWALKSMDLAWADCFTGNKGSRKLQDRGALIRPRFHALAATWSTASSFSKGSLHAARQAFE